MRLQRRVPLALILLASAASAQTADSKRSVDFANDAPGNSALPKQVALARCAYRQSEAGCPATLGDKVADNALAQMPRRIGPMGPPMRGPYYSDSWGPRPSTAQVLIGAAIGFTFGAAAGSKNGVRSAFAVGTLVGLLGAGIGAGIPAFPSHFRSRRGWDDDEDASLRKPKPGRPYSPRPNKLAEDATSQPGATETYQKNDFSGR